MLRFGFMPFLAVSVPETVKTAKIFAPAAGFVGPHTPTAKVLLTT